MTACECYPDLIRTKSGHAPWCPANKPSEPADPELKAIEDQVLAQIDADHRGGKIAAYYEEGARMAFAAVRPLVERLEAELESTGEVQALKKREST